MELAAVCNKRQFNLENVTMNSTLKQSKSIEISKDMVLILQIYRIYEKKERDEYSVFLRKKEG
jgi:replicative DNA helicase